MENTQQIEELLLLTSGICRKFTRDPNIPSDVNDEELSDLIQAAAPLLLILFGSPVAAAEGISETFDQLFSRLDRVEGALDRIEESLTKLEQKHDAATLSKFRAGFRELRDGMRGRKRSYREQLILSARNKLTEIAELPPGLKYSELPSQTIAAASCLLIAIIDTWSGEIAGAQRYNLRAIVADPLWSEEFLPKSLIRSLASALLDDLERDTLRKVKKESERIYDFFWKKVGTGVVGGGGALIAGIFGVGGAIGPAIGGAIGEINRLNSAEAQKEAHDMAIMEIKKAAMRKREDILRIKATERLKKLGD